jgi:hypothetical protein
MGRRSALENARHHYETYATSIFLFIPPAISAIYEDSKGMTINEWLYKAYPNDMMKYSCAFSCKSKSKWDASCHHTNGGLSSDFDKFNLYPGWVKNARSFYFQFYLSGNTMEKIRLFIEDFCCELASAGIDNPEMNMSVFDPLDRYPRMYPFGLLKDFYFEAMSLQEFFNRRLFWGYSHKEAIKGLTLPDKWAEITANRYTHDEYTQLESHQMRKLESYKAYFANPVVPESKEEKHHLWWKLGHNPDFKKALESLRDKKTAA